MRGWNSRSSWLIPRRCWIQPASTKIWSTRPLLLKRPLSTKYSHSNHSSSLGYSPFGAYESRLKRDRPHHRDVDAWITLLDGALPVHLRLPENVQSLKNLEAMDVAEILLAAQYPTNNFFDTSTHRGIDLLFHLGFAQSRWDAVVWLVKYMVENLPYPSQRIADFSETAIYGPEAKSLDKETERPVHNYHVDALRHHGLPSLDEVCDGLLKTPSFEETLSHNALGQIWRTLGSMTQACAGGDIRPEVLELLAYIHHQGFMPESVYRYSAHPDTSAIQQPPLLSLLSSRIFTSLSDAAWRAHERAVIAEAKSRNDDYAAHGLELRSSVYRVNIAGLRPEVWMELILWSSLHGGWLFHGFTILHALATEKTKDKWRPLSWQQYESQLNASSKMLPSDWENLDYLFKTRDISTMDDPSGPIPQIGRTVSAEVVNAYIDALVNTISVGVGDRGVAVESLITQLHQMKVFLGRSKLSVSTGTWDALIMRLIDYRNVIPEQARGPLQNLISLSTGIGQGLDSNNTQYLPSYVLDGNTMIQGLLHRALDGQIASGNLNGAMSALKVLQERNDMDKRKSLANFMAKYPSIMSHKGFATGTFTSNFAGIDYPTLDSQIPPAILGRFLNLVTDAKAYDFGRWLFYSQDIDGPIIDARLYTHPALQPAILRFAVETNDKSLTSHFKGDLMSMESLRTLLDSQVNLKNWDGALRVLRTMKSTYHITWTAGNLANLGQKLLLQSDGASANKKNSSNDSQKARQMFVDMVQGEYDDARPIKKQESIRSLLLVLSSVDSRWAVFCRELDPFQRPVTFSLGTTAFNSILEGIAEAYGSVTAQNILEKFWPASARQATISQSNKGRGRMPRFRPRALESPERHRIELRLPGMTSENKAIVVLGSLAPIPYTFTILLQGALKELRMARSKNSSNVGDAVAAAHDVICWSLEHLFKTQSIDNSEFQDLSRTLSKAGIELPDALRQLMRADVSSDMNESGVDTDEAEPN